MRKELDEKVLKDVSGGTYFIDNTDTVFFKNIVNDGYKLKKSRYGAMELMDGLKGKYATDAEYDAACLQALQDNGYI